MDSRARTVTGFAAGYNLDSVNDMIRYLAFPKLLELQVSLAAPVGNHSMPILGALTQVMDLSETSPDISSMENPNSAMQTFSDGSFSIAFNNAGGFGVMAYFFSTSDTDPAYTFSPPPTSALLSAHATTNNDTYLTFPGLDAVYVVTCGYGNRCTDRYISGCLLNEECTETFSDFVCDCNHGYELSDPAHCDDINECAVTNGDCLTDHVCINAPGSFSCQCDPYLPFDEVNSCEAFSLGCGADRSEAEWTYWQAVEGPFAPGQIGINSFVDDHKIWVTPQGDVYDRYRSAYLFDYDTGELRARVLRLLLRLLPGVRRRARVRLRHGHRRVVLSEQHELWL